jgi:hypothetical protein
MPTDERSNRRLPKPVRAAIFMASGLPVLIGLFLFKWLAWGPFSGYVRTLSWRETPCLILTSGVKGTGESSSRGQPTYRPQYLYSYSVDGKEYQSDRYSFFLMTIDSRAIAEREAALHPAGSRATCYVDPADPKEAVFSRRFEPFQLIGILFPGVFVLGGLGMAWVALVGGRRSSPDAPPAAPALPQPDEEAAASLGPGAVTLVADGTPFGSLVGTTFFGCAWNGILAAMAYMPLRDKILEHGITGLPRYFIQEVSHDPGILGGLLCPAPFILIGLLFLVSIPWQLLALLNPRPRLTLAAASVAAGGSVRLQWRFSRSAGRMKRLTIVAVAQQVTGPKRRSHDALKLTVLDIAPPAALDEGVVVLKIPAEAPMSDVFENPTTWALKLTGWIPYWPDVEWSFPFVVTRRG